MHLCTASKQQTLTAELRAAAQALASEIVALTESLTESDVGAVRLREAHELAAQQKKQHGHLTELAAMSVQLADAAVHAILQFIVMFICNCIFMIHLCVYMLLRARRSGL